jgi:uncharacterized protein (TIGR02996 family)
MHPDQSALYRGIVANPHDDLPRLVYADWLEEHGRDERAEFIRVQCALAHSTPDDAGHYDLLERERELAEILEEELRAEEPELPPGFRAAYSHSRGMLDGVRLDWRDPDMPTGQTVSDLEAVAELLPLCRLEHCGESGYEPEAANDQPDIAFLRHTISQRLTSLSFRFTGSEPRIDQLEATLAASPNLGNLRELRLPTLQTDDERFAALARVETLPGLRSLRLNTRGLTVASNTAWRSAGWRPRLTHLILERYRDDYLALIEGCSFPALRSLHLTADTSDGLMQQLHADAVFPRLTSLTLDSRDPYPHRHIDCRVPLDRPLRELTLRAMDGGYPSFGQLFRSPGRRSLRSLTLVTPEAVRGWLASLSAGASYPELRHLDLDLYGADRDTLLQLARAPVWATVTSLTLTCVHRVSEDDWGEFFRALHAPALRHLTTQDLQLQNAGGLALAENRTLAGLRRLEIRFNVLNRLSSKALKALLSAPQFQNLLVLTLSGTRGGKEFKVLADPAVLPHARRIDLYENRFPPAVAARLRARPGVVIRE